MLLTARRAAGALALTLLAAAGCARTGPTGPPAAPGAAAPGAAAPQPPALLRTTDLRLPLDAYQPSTAEVAVIASGYRALLHACMAGYGYAFPPAGQPGAAGPRTRNERRYGLTDPAAAALGYRYAAVAPQDGRQTRAALAPAERAALTGEGARRVAGRPVPAGGCATWARTRLTAGVPAGADTDLPQQLSAQSLGQSAQEPAVKAAVAQWAACMNARGYHYTGPFEPAADPRFRGALTAAETATARADIACKQRTNLVGIWAGADAALQRTLVARNAAALTLAAAATRAQLAAARTALRPVR